MEQSRQPFGPAMKALMKRRGVSYRDLDALTDTAGTRLSSGYLNHISTGRQAPTIDNMRVVAAALGVQPEYFREYREHKAGEAARLLAARHGMDAVMAKLAELDEDAQPRVEPSSRG